MSDFDKLFRQGLGARKPEVPADMWERIAASKGQLPEGEALDRLFAGKLAQRQAPVPPGMWQRIVAARRPVAYARYALFLLLFALLGTGGYRYLAGPQVNVDTAPVPTTPAAVPSVADEQAPEESREISVAGATSYDAPSPQAATTKVTPTQGTRPPDVADEQTLTASASDRSAPPAAAAAAEAAPRVTNLTATGTITTLPPDLLPTAPLLPDAGPARDLPYRQFTGSNRHRFTAEVLGGVAYAHQQFGLRQEGARLQRSLREVSEFPEVSYQLSARLRYRLAGRWKVIGGLTYLGIRNQFEYETSTGGVQELLRSNNRLHLLEVPLLASYELPGRRLRLSINAGPVLNLVTGVSGQFLHPASRQPLDLADRGQYRRHTGLGWTTSLTTTYTVGKQRTTQLLLEPFFKHYPGSFTTPAAALTERYWVAGLQLGLRKSL